MTTSPTTAAPREKSGGKAALLVIVGLLVLVAGAWGAAYLIAGDNTPRGTTVEGVVIGGMTQDEAVAELTAGLADRVNAPIPVSVAGEETEVVPEKAGFQVDYAASVAAAGGERSLSPRRLWNHFTGGEDLDAVVDVDEAALAGVLEALTESAGTPPEDGRIEFRQGRVVTTDPENGEEVDTDAAQQDLLAAYLTEGGAPTVELGLREVSPEIDAEVMQSARDSFANPAMSGPVTLLFGESPVRLRPRQFSPALSMVADGGRLVPVVDAERLTALVEEGTSATEPVDATVVLRDGKPRVVPAKPGVGFEPEQVVETFTGLLSKTGAERRGEIEATVVDPEFSTADARKLGIREQVSTFTTNYPHAAYRNTNIGRAAELVDQTLLKPGETFSMNDIVGERTAANGFTEGFIISNGIFKSDLGGGVSQMATTLFNAMFFAGLEDVEHKPHSFYIDRYPVGREATVAWGSVDLRFRNDTEYGVLVAAHINPSTPGSEGSVTVSMYSTKVWDITTTTSDRYAFTSPATRTLDTADCYPNSGYGGFDVDVTRFFRRPGSSELVRTEVFNTTYTPSDTVICKPPGSLSAPPAGQRGGPEANND